MLLDQPSCYGEKHPLFVAMTFYSREIRVTTVSYLHVRTLLKKGPSKNGIIPVEMCAT